jgi:hypothetical protein
MGVCCTESEMFALPEVHRVFIPTINHARAEDWLLLHDSVYYSVSRMYPEGREISCRVFLINDEDIAFELKMRFG